MFTNLPHFFPGGVFHLVLHVRVSEANPRVQLVMIDPDAPSREGDGSAPGSSGPWLHALWSNCAGGSTTSCDQPMTVEYEPPTPPAGTGKHRYIFLLFKQDGSIDVDHLETTRAKWDVKGFVKANDLEPLALNFFYATP